MILFAASPAPYTFCQPFSVSLARMAASPLDQHLGSIWYDGAFVPLPDAKLHVLSYGLHYASAVFEGIRSYHGKIFKLHEHVERLFRSADLLGMRIPYSQTEVETAIKETVTKNNMRDCYIRPIVWRGSESLGIIARNLTIHLAIACWEWTSYFSPEKKAEGITLCMAPWARPAPDTAVNQAKASGMYITCTLSEYAAQDKGFDDALMLDHKGHIAEVTASNIFMVKDGVLITPATGSILEGITRATILQLARAKGIETVEREIAPSELADMSEIFLTGTAVEITPVRQIEDMRFAVGPITKLLMQDFYDLTQKGA